MTTIANKIANLNLPETTKVKLSLSEGCDVFVHNETEVETALENTTVVDSYVSLILEPNFEVTTTWGQNPIEQLREAGLLEDYDRTGWFESYLTEAIYDNFYDAEVIDHSTEKYDHKRGFTTLHAELYTTIGSVVDSGASLYGWDVTVETPSGDLTLS